MARVSYDRVVAIQDGWKDIHLPEDMKVSMVTLTNELMHRLIDNGHELEGVSLLYPDDCNDYNVFTKVAYGLGALVTIREGGGLVMQNFGQHHDDVEVE